MDTSGYDPETGRTFTRAEPHEITHEGCVWTDEQIRELVPHGVVRTADGFHVLFQPFSGGVNPNDYLTSSQVAERVLRCESCGGSGRLPAGGIVQGRPMGYGNGAPCPSCESLRTLLLKLAGEGVR